MAPRGIVGAVAVIAVAAGATVGVDALTAKSCTVVDLDNARHARVLDHAHDAIKRGLPERLTVDRLEGAANRRASLRGIPTRPGFDRDEYPPAVSDEGGKGASVRYVASAENRSAGSILGQELRGLPDGSCFRYEARPVIPRDR